MIWLTLLGSLPFSSVWADTGSGDEKAESGHESRAHLAVGAAVSDIGGGNEPGPALALGSTRLLGSSQAILCFGVEYVRKSGYGEVVDRNMSTGEVLYQGSANVDLHYLQATVALGYELDISAFEIAPYFGIGPTVLLSQTVEPAEPVSAGALDGYHGYKSLNVLFISGLIAHYSRAVLDVQLALGLFDQEESESSHGSPLQGESSTSRSFRVALGVAF